MPGVSSCCHLEKIWSLSPLRSLMFSQKSDVLSSPFPFSMLLYLLLPCLTAPRPGFKWGWIFDHPSSMLPWEAWSGLWIGFVYTAPMWRLLCESSQSILSKNRSSAPPSGPFIIDVLWKKRGGIFFFFHYRHSGKDLLSHSKYQSTFQFWPLRWLTDRTMISGVCRKLRLKLITCPFHCYYRNKFK